MTDQPELWGVPLDGPVDQPKRLCPRCGQPCRRYRGQWKAYCGGRQCTSPVRLCKNPDCPRPERRYTVAEGFALYCSVECRHLRTWGPPRPKHVCPIDGTEHKLSNRWRLCGACLAKIRPATHALVKHNVPTDLVIALVKDPTCMVPGCTANLLDYIRTRDIGGRRLTLHVDHDHACPICRGAPASCGECVRGLVCYRHNIIFGMAYDDPGMLDGGARYLRAWGSRSDGFE